MDDRAVRLALRGKADARALTKLADLIAKVNAKTQRYSTVIPGPISIGNQDLAVTWPVPWPDTAYAVIISFVSGTGALGNLHGTLKVGTKTVDGCTVTVAAAAIVGADVGVDVIGIRT